MRSKLHKFNEVISWILLIATSVLLIFTLHIVKEAKKTGEGAFLFGYRPTLVLTGSMEPTMLTNGVFLAKEVDDINDVEVGDIVTFHVESQDGTKLVITHRIISIDENGVINTKGDNNSVSDDLGLTIDNIEAKVVCIFNQTAWIANQWKTTSGKVVLISFGMAIVFAYFSIKMLISSSISRKKDTYAEESDPDSEDFSGGEEPQEKPRPTKGGAFLKK